MSPTRVVLSARYPQARSTCDVLLAVGIVINAPIEGRVWPSDRCTVIVDPGLFNHLF